MWKAFSFIGGGIKQAPGLHDTRFGMLVATPVPAGLLSWILRGVWPEGARESRILNARSWPAAEPTMGGNDIVQLLWQPTFGQYGLAMVVGALIVLAIALQGWLRRVGIPSLVGFIALGLILHVLDDRWELVAGDRQAVLDILAAIGLFALLFRVGLESNLHALVEKLPRAVPIWLGNMALSGVPAFIVSRYILDIGLIASMFVATALTATSVAVSVGVWQEADALASEDGETLLDVAELDDISGVALLALILAIAPVLHAGDGASLVPTLSQVGLALIVKMLLFGAVCLLLARFGERPIRWFTRRYPQPDPILVVTGIGIVVAMLAGQLGFSLAIGALFAGLVFSRDPDAVKLDTAFGPLHDFFVPFFFIGVGLKMEIAAAGPVVLVAAVLFVVAVAGKVIGAGAPALLTTGWMGAGLIGVSMVPCAEIAMVVMQEGRRLGDWAVPAEVYTAMVLVAAATCIAAPPVIGAMLRRAPDPSR